jgi:hypothetical protein
MRMQSLHRNVLAAIVAATFAVSAPAVDAQGKSQEKKAEQAEKKQAKHEAKAVKHEAKAVQKIARQNAKAARRLDDAQRRALISQQQARVLQYRSLVDQQRLVAARTAQQLEEARRLQQAQYVADYNRRVWEQQQRYRTQAFNYDSDPYFNYAPAYSYLLGGQTYRINEPGADLLREAINLGYQEGIRAGRADRMDGWRADYRNSYAYQDATYGYSGYYLDRNQYAHYFREGFRRGYDDGYYSRYQYGRASGNGTATILASLLSSILNLRQY